jgi:glycerol kinase
VYGKTKGVKALPDGIPVAGIAGDQQAALFGQACFEPGEAKCTYGTGAFLLQNTGPEPVFSSRGLLTTVAWSVGGEVAYALEGSSFIAGAAVQWLRDGLGLIKKAADVEALAKQVKDAGDVVFVPALAGLGAPHWRPEARGVIRGIDRGTTAAHLARATLEGIAFLTITIAVITSTFVARAEAERAAAEDADDARADEQLQAGIDDLRARLDRVEAMLARLSEP